MSIFVEELGLITIHGDQTKLSVPMMSCHENDDDDDDGDDVAPAA